MTISLRLDRGQRRRMQRLLRKTRSRIEALRARILLLLDEGVVPGVVAEMVGCARATLYRTLYRFEDLGEDGLLDRRQLRPPSKVTAEIEARLVGYIDGSPQDFGWQRTTWTLELLAVQLTLDAGVRLSRSHVRNVLLANQVRRGRPRVGLRIPVRGRRRILRDIDRLVERADAKDEVFYVDEGSLPRPRRCPSPRLPARQAHPPHSRQLHHPQVEKDALPPGGDRRPRRAALPAALFAGVEPDRAALEAAARPRHPQPHAPRHRAAHAGRR